MPDGTTPDGLCGVGECVAVGADVRIGVGDGVGVRLGERVRIGVGVGVGVGVSEGVGVVVGSERGGESPTIKYDNVCLFSRSPTMSSMLSPAFRVMPWLIKVWLISR